jgi:hypothetical protein
MKFFCLLSYCFASRQHRQIFRHHQTKGDISNIADAYAKCHSVDYHGDECHFAISHQAMDIGHKHQASAEV